jgi:hypothetical protein
MGRSYIFINFLTKENLDEKLLVAKPKSQKSFQDGRKSLLIITQTENYTESLLNTVIFNQSSVLFTIYYRQNLSIIALLLFLVKLGEIFRQLLCIVSVMLIKCLVNY